jgi:hypothetical protein
LDSTSCCAGRCSELTFSVLDFPAHSNPNGLFASEKLPTDLLVDEFAEKIRVTVVSCVLLNHVDVNPPKRARLTLAIFSEIVKIMP